MGTERAILTVNAGSSSIRFAYFRLEHTLVRVFAGKVDRIGLDGSTVAVRSLERGTKEVREVSASNHAEAIGYVIDWLTNLHGLNSLAGVGHRIVHGGPRHFDPERITPDLLDDLRTIQPYDPEHLPLQIQLAEQFGRRFTHLPQIACFDTAFHRELPKTAQLMPLPRRLFEAGVRRYGFHGLSYEFLLDALEREAGTKAARGRAILAHLGNGSSLAAVWEGKSIDTTMGFTPAAGIPMSTRSGDIDPGLVWFLNRTEQQSAREWNAMVNSESGLFGISQTSGDIRDLLQRERSDSRSAEALELFCYGIKKAIGSFAAALGGLDTIVFSGGIGENAPEIRKRICQGLEFLGIELDVNHNERNEAVISTSASHVTVRVIRTDEELIIARNVCRVLGMETRE